MCFCSARESHSSATVSVTPMRRASWSIWRRKALGAPASTSGRPCNPAKGTVRRPATQLSGAPTSRCRAVNSALSRRRAPRRCAAGCRCRPRRSPATRRPPRPRHRARAGGCPDSAGSAPDRRATGTADRSRTARRCRPDRPAARPAAPDPGPAPRPPPARPARADTGGARPRSGHAATRAQEQAAAAGSIAASWRLTADCAPSRRAATLVRLPRSAIWMNKRH